MRLVGQKLVSKFMDSFAYPASPSSFLFFGMGHVGKTTAAVEFARRNLCLRERADNCSCDSCLELSRGINPDFYKLDFEHGKISELRSLAAKLESSAMRKMRAVVISGIDNASLDALSVLLKSIEEPHNAIYVFTCENMANVSAPFRSRCITVRFNPLSDSDLLEIGADKWAGDIKSVLKFNSDNLSFIGREPSAYFRASEIIDSFSDYICKQDYISIMRIPEISASEKVCDLVLERVRKSVTSAIMSKAGQESSADSLALQLSYRKVDFLDRVYLESVRLDNPEIALRRIGLLLING